MPSLGFSLGLTRRVLDSGFAAPTLSLSETGDTEISYTIGQVSGANQYRVEKSTDLLLSGPCGEYGY